MGEVHKSNEKGKRRYRGWDIGIEQETEQSVRAVAIADGTTDEKHTK